MPERNRDPAVPEAGKQVADTMQAARPMRRSMDWTLRQRNCGTLPRIRLLEPVPKMVEKTPVFDRADLALKI